MRSARRRRLALYIKPDGTLELRIPAASGEKAVKEFLTSAAPWLEKQQKLRRQAAAHRPPPGSVIAAGREYKVQYSPHCQEAHLTSEGAFVLPERCRGSKALTDEYMTVFYRRLAAEIMTPLAAGFAAMLGKKPASVKITKAASRWGSCSKQGNINFSWRTARLPLRLAELIAAHEAAHLAEMNHSNKFYSVLETLLPDRKAREEELKKERLKYADQ